MGGKISGNAGHPRATTQGDTVTPSIYIYIYIFK